MMTHRYPNEEEIEAGEKGSIKMITLTQGEVPWTPRKYSDGEVEEFQRKVNEQSKADQESNNINQTLTLPMGVNWNEEIQSNSCSVRCFKHLTDLGCSVVRVKDF